MMKDVRYDVENLFSLEDASQVSECPAPASNSRFMGPLDTLLSSLLKRMETRITNASLLKAQARDFQESGDVSVFKSTKHL
jgi:hypothetical protein